MPDWQNSNYLQDAVERLAAGLRLLTDAAGATVALQVQAYLEPLPAIYPCIVMLPGGGQLFSEQTGGDPYEMQTFTIAIRYYIGKLGEMYDGGLQTALWERQVLLINYINAHPDLVFSADQDHLDTLMPIGVRATAISRAGVFRDTPEHIGVEIAVSLPFYPSVTEIVYPDER